MGELEKRAKWGLENLKKCFVAPDKIVASKLGDDLKFSFSMTYVNQALEKGILTSEEVESAIKGEQVLPDNKEKETETESCLQ